MAANMAPRLLSPANESKKTLMLEGSRWMSLSDEHCFPHAFLPLRRAAVTYEGEKAGRKEQSPEEVLWRFII